MYYRYSYGSHAPGGSTAQKSGSLKTYLDGKGWFHEYNLFKSMVKDGELSYLEKQLIDYFNSLPKDYQRNKQILRMF